MKIRKYQFIVTVALAMLIFTALSTAQSGFIRTGDERAAVALTAAYKVLGGENNIGNIKSIVVTGTRTEMTASGKNSVPLEIRLMLPDYIMKIQTRISSDGTPPVIAYEGVSEGEARMAVGTEQGGYRSMSSSNTLVVDPLFNEMTRLLLGTLLQSGPITPLTLTSSGDRFTVTSPEGVFGTIEFDPAINCPIAIRYKETVSITNPTTKKMESQLVDVIMQFSNREEISGVMFPKTITWKSSENSALSIDRELKIEKIQINSGLTRKDFDVPE